MIDTLVKCKTKKKKMGEMYEFSLSLFRCEVAHSSGASGVFRSCLGLTSWCDPTPACGQDLWCASNDTLRQGVCVILCDDITVSCKMSVVTLSPSPSSSPVVREARGCVGEAHVGMDTGPPARRWVVPGTTWAGKWVFSQLSVRMSQAVPELQAHRSREIINVCCFQLPSSYKKWVLSIECFGLNPSSCCSFSICTTCSVSSFCLHLDWVLFHAPLYLLYWISAINLYLLFFFNRKACFTAQNSTS